METTQTTAMETTWGPSGGYGDDANDMGMTGMMWGPWGQHGVETTEITAMGTTWGPSGGYGDNVRMMGMTRGRCGDDRDNGDNVGTMGTTESLKMP